jgi:hypothetical protein
MRYPGCAAGGMRRVRRNAASKLNNGRCTSQNKRYELASSVGRKLRDCDLEAPPLFALKSRKVDIIWGAQERAAQGRPLCARPSSDAKILGHRLLVATASPGHLGNRKRVLCPKRLEHGAIVAPSPPCATLQVVSGLLPA